MISVTTHTMAANPRHRTRPMRLLVPIKLTKPLGAIRPTKPLMQIWPIRPFRTVWSTTSKNTGWVTKKVLKEAKHALTEKKKITTLATKHLLMLKELKSNTHELKDKLADKSPQCAALAQMSMVQLHIKRQRTIGCWGGAGSWPVLITVYCNDQ